MLPKENHFTRAKRVIWPGQALLLSMAEETFRAGLDLYNTLCQLVLVGWINFTHKYLMQVHQEIINFSNYYITS